TAWLNDGHEVVTNEGSTAPGNWKATATRAELIATPDDVSNAKAGVQLIDARGTERFYGINKRDYVSAFGHIRGAKILPTELLFRKDRDAIKFYSPEAYRSILEISDIEADKPTIFYCNSGHLAAGPWFIEHELVGNSKARLLIDYRHNHVIFCLFFLLPPISIPISVTIRPIRSFSTDFLPWPVSGRFRMFHQSLQVGP
ncbi:MAG: hypothetical protein JAY82_14380, partial [Candidatus Thiodiazotropha taylori]|nr:hypothetical protein [Candidatus Thiodiazotropha taylori]